ncbi:TM2 domain-containing protein [Pedomonas mirosovicensis]|uniref:TM2 domain-containing protein n=1 Tax=Pedomonas mirosovicensis TaxID=2908641 RepID=UPI002166E468|nr:TM2 domain-containing protein [Pedomonas mirosovicensis]MCH8685280.1 TM2 domain-containing protein [Pedomonas mirosovicensis]
MENEAKNAALSQMLFQANSKSIGVAYLLWFFIGTFGAHRFYMGRTGTAIAQLVLAILGLITIFFGVGIFILGAVGIWVLVDAFLIPGIIRAYNTELAQKVIA